MEEKERKQRERDRKSEWDREDGQSVFKCVFVHSVFLIAKSLPSCVGLYF